MEIDQNTINKIAHLSRLEFDQTDTHKITQDIIQILSWVEKLNEVNTDGVEPLTTLSYEVNSLREDMVNESIGKINALYNAPGKNTDYFQVPRVLG